MKRYNGRDITTIVFILIQMILYVAFLTLDFSNDGSLMSRNIKYSVIILCFCYALFCKNRAGKGIIFCLKAGLFFTLISDLFLLILDHYIFGVITFIIVQQLYGLRIILANNERRAGLINEGIQDGAALKRLIITKFISRLILEILAASVIYFILTLTGVTLELLLLISVFYFVCILTNAVTAIISAIHLPKRQNVLFSVGMGLFLLCDINVGLFNLSGFVNMPENLYDVLYGMSTILMWTFYAPSQVLIALSVRQFSQKSK